MTNYRVRSVITTGLFCCVAAAHAQRGQGAKLKRLIADVQNALPNASISDDRKAKLQGDLDSLKSQVQAAQDGGHRPDRDKMTAIVSDMRSLVDSGAFKNEDQQALDKEFDGLLQH